MPPKYDQNVGMQIHPTAVEDRPDWSDFLPFESVFYEIKDGVPKRLPQIKEPSQLYSQPDLKFMNDQQNVVEKIQEIKISDDKNQKINQEPKMKDLQSATKAKSADYSTVETPKAKIAPNMKDQKSAPKAKPKVIFQCMDIRLRDPEFRKNCTVNGKKLTEKDDDCDEEYVFKSTKVKLQKSSKRDPMETKKQSTQTGPQNSVSHSEVQLELEKKGYSKDGEGFDDASTIMA